jgi:DNA-binding CsgD family transcriptional regulator
MMIVNTRTPADSSAQIAHQLRCVLSDLAGLREKAARTQVVGRVVAPDLQDRLGGLVESLRLASELATASLRDLDTPSGDVARSPRPRAPVGYGWDSLTRAELQVIRVITAGCTNRQAAARLCLSPHTVNSHLRHVYTKLGINSRVELVRMVLARHRPTGTVQATA